MKKIVLAILTISILTSCPPPEPPEPLVYVAPPNDVTAVFEGEFVKVTWEESDTASGHRVYKKINGGNWIPISPVISSPVYQDETLHINQNVTYSVRAFENDNYSSYESMQGSVVVETQDQIVKNLQVQYLQSTAGIDMNWEPLADAETYLIYRTQEKGTIGEEVGRTTGFSFSDTPSGANELNKDTLYYYNVYWQPLDGSYTGGAIQRSQPGYFSSITDPREPLDDDELNITTDSFPNEDPRELVLYKFADLSDTDWFRHTVPESTEHYLRIKTVSGFPGDNPSIQVYKDGTLQVATDFSTSGATREIALPGTFGLGPTDYTIKVTPNSVNANDSYLGIYSIEVSTTF